MLLFRALGLFALFGAIAAATTYEATPTEDSLFLWGIFPQANINAKVGDTIHFKTLLNRHDIGLVPTATELDNCDLSNFVQWVNTTAHVQSGAPGSTTIDGFLYDYQFTLTDSEIGTWYFVCSIAAGSHCRTGQKMTLTVEAGTPSSEPLRVMASSDPFWTVGLRYDDMTIKLGDSVSFTSDMEGYHDVAVLIDEECPDAECCTFGGMEESDRTVLYTKDEFKAADTYVWTPTAVGTYHLVCSINNGGHCVNGQQFKVTVEAAEEVEAGDSSATAATPAALLALVAVAASVLYAQ